MCAVEQVRYYPLGDNMFPDMLADLKMQETRFT